MNINNNFKPPIKAIDVLPNDSYPYAQVINVRRMNNKSNKQEGVNRWTRMDAEPQPHFVRYAIEPFFGYKESQIKKIHRDDLAREERINEKQEQIEHASFEDNLNTPLITTNHAEATSTSKVLCCCCCTASDSEDEDADDEEDDAG